MLFTCICICITWLQWERMMSADQPKTHPSTPSTGFHFLSPTQGHSSSNFPFFLASLFHLPYEIICMTIKHSVIAVSSLDPPFCLKLLPFLFSPWNQHFSKCWLYSVSLLSHVPFSLEIFPPRLCSPHFRRTVTLIQTTQGLFATKFIEKFLGFILLSLLSTMTLATLSYKMSHR